jgi:hypothetical protein
MSAGMPAPCTLDKVSENSSLEVLHIDGGQMNRFGQPGDVRFHERPVGSLDERYRAQFGGTYL